MDTNRAFSRESFSALKKLVDTHQVFENVFMSNKKAGGYPPGILKTVVIVFKKAGGYQPSIFKRIIFGSEKACGYPPGILKLLFVE